MRAANSGYSGSCALLKPRASGELRFLLTSTYMDVGYTEAIGNLLPQTARAAHAASRISSRHTSNFPSRLVFCPEREISEKSLCSLIMNCSALSSQMPRDNLSSSAQGGAYSFGPWKATTA